jgi:hypothetical protein
LRVYTSTDGEVHLSLPYQKQDTFNTLQERIASRMDTTGRQFYHTCEGAAAETIPLTDYVDALAKVLSNMPNSKLFFVAEPVCCAIVASTRVVHWQRQREQQREQQRQQQPEQH